MLMIQKPKNHKKQKKELINKKLRMRSLRRKSSLKNHKNYSRKE
jgi:hypothetical protein